MILGIDASNIRGGGGVTHLVELLKAAKPGKYGFKKVIVWSGKNTLDHLNDRPWLIKVNETLLNKSLIHRTYWQKFKLDKLLQLNKCDVVFVPGGTYSGNFRPYVTLSQNLLPFEWKEMGRYGFSWQFIRNLLLRFTQSATFRKADGLVFLTEYAKKTVINVIGKPEGSTIIIPHGINRDFSHKVKKQRKSGLYNKSNPLKILYVSMIDVYKHQENVVKAVKKLLDQGYFIRLDLVGPAYLPSYKKLQKTLKDIHMNKKYPIEYQGAVEHGSLKKWYENADIFVFASSCENMPIILMEAMIAGLPIACSGYGPMPEVLKNYGVYFNPENPDNIADGIRQLLDSTLLRTKNANGAYKNIMSNSWEKCSHDTFSFFQKIAKNYKEKPLNV